MKIKISSLKVQSSIFLSLALLASMYVTEVRQKHSSKSNDAFLSIRYTKKLTSPLKLTIQPASSSTPEAGESYTLNAIVTSEVDAKELTLEWVVPESSQIISGEQKVFIPEMLAGQSKEFEILLEQRTYENSQIHAVVSGKNDSSSFGNTAQHNSIHQPAIDRSLSSLKKRSQKHEQKAKARQNQAQGHNH